MTISSKPTKKYKPSYDVTHIMWSFWVVKPGKDHIPFIGLSSKEYPKETISALIYSNQIKHSQILELIQQRNCSHTFIFPPLVAKNSMLAELQGSIKLFQRKTKYKVYYYMMDFDCSVCCLCATKTCASKIVASTTMQKQPMKPPMTTNGRF